MAKCQTRDEYLEAAKQRALKMVDRDPMGALTMMMADLAHHPETKDHKGIDVGMQLLMIGSLSSPVEARRFIDGFR